MLKIEELREVIKESPLFEKWGTEMDIEAIINRIKASLNPAPSGNNNKNSEPEV